MVVSSTNSRSQSILMLLNSCSDSISMSMNGNSLSYSSDSDLILSIKGTFRLLIQSKVNTGLLNFISVSPLTEIDFIELLGGCLLKSGTITGSSKPRSSFGTTFLHSLQLIVLRCISSASERVEEACFCNYGAFSCISFSDKFSIISSSFVRSKYGFFAVSY